MLLFSVENADKCFFFPIIVCFLSHEKWCNREKSGEPLFLYYLAERRSVFVAPKYQLSRLLLLRIFHRKVYKYPDRIKSFSLFNRGYYRVIYTKVVSIILVLLQ